MLIIGQPHKMHRDIRNSKGSRALSAILMEIPASGEDHNVSNLVFSPCMSECLVKLKDIAMSLLHFSPSQNILKRQSSLRHVIPLCNAEFRQSVPSKNLFSITYGFVASF